uniref:CHL-CPN10 n=1 Tax=Oryza punctata TaxID=4537 RepID=A0A0E0MAW5_ORYPU
MRSHLRKHREEAIVNLILLDETEADKRSASLPLLFAEALPPLLLEPSAPPALHRHLARCLQMAPSLLAAASPFLLHGAAAASGSRRPLVAATGRRAASSLRVAALKYDPSKVAPQSDRVLVRLEQIPEKSVGGVLLPKSAVKFERYLMGEILSVGADVNEVEAGKKVLFSDINAYEVDLGTDEKHCFCRESDLLAVVE